MRKRRKKVSEAIRCRFVVEDHWGEAVGAYQTRGAAVRELRKLSDGASVVDGMSHRGAVYIWQLAGIGRYRVAVPVDYGRGGARFEEDTY